MVMRRSDFEPIGLLSQSPFYGEPSSFFGHALQVSLLTGSLKSLATISQPPVHLLANESDTFRTLVDSQRVERFRGAEPRKRPVETAVLSLKTVSVAAS